MSYLKHWNKSSQETATTQVFELELRLAISLKIEKSNEASRTFEEKLFFRSNNKCGPERLQTYLEQIKSWEDNRAFASFLFLVMKTF